jgi:dihydrofolate synthase/folylpolyglutamate synthase
MQTLSAGPLTDQLPTGSVVWLDGGHNPDAGAAIAKTLEDGPPVHVIIGMLMNKDALGFMTPFAHKIESLYSVPISGHEHHEPLELCRIAKDDLGIAAAAPVGDVDTAMVRIARNGLPSNVLICGSLYLAGEVLRANDQVPD